MIDWLWQTDVALTRLINDTWSSPYLDGPLYLMANQNKLLIPLAMAIVLIAIYGKFRGRLFLFAMLVTLILGDAGTNWTFKLNVNRPRPKESVDNLRIYSDGEFKLSKARHVEKGRSFTSGHACNNWALALVGTAVYGLAGVWWLWPWAIAMGYSRVYSADHFPSDVLGSWVVATIYTLLILRGIQWAWQKWAPAKLPGLYRAHPQLFLWGAAPPAEAKADCDDPNPITAPAPKQPV